MEVKCPGCGATFKVPEDTRTYTCPYCGLVFGEKKPGEDHYYFPAIREEPYSLLLRYVQRQFGVPSDIALNSSLRRRELHYVPVYFYYVYGRVSGECGRYGWTEAEEGAYIGIVASERFSKLLEDYPFPVRGKKFFSQEVYRLGRYHEPEFDEAEARRRAERKLDELLRGELRKQCKSLRGVKEHARRVEYRGLIHYPIYHLSYAYGGSLYQAFIDGSDGKIILAEHPLKLQTRILQLSVAAGLIFLALAMGGLISLGSGSLIPLIPPLLTSIITSIPLLKRTVSRKVTASELKALGREAPHLPRLLQYL